MGISSLIYSSDVVSHGMWVTSGGRCTDDSIYLVDDAAAHISEEVTGAARATPVAMLTGVLATEFFGFLIMIAASFASTSVADLRASELPLPMGQLFLNVLGKKGMLAMWSVLISIQVRFWLLAIIIIVIWFSGV